jgi:hypothetical protein
MERKVGRDLRADGQAGRIGTMTARSESDSELYSAAIHSAPC